MLLFCVTGAGCCCCEGCCCWLDADLGDLDCVLLEIDEEEDEVDELENGPLFEAVLFSFVCSVCVVSSTDIAPSAGCSLVGERRFDDLDLD